MVALVGCTDTNVDGDPAEHWFASDDQTSWRELTISDAPCAECIGVDPVIVLGDTIGPGFIGEEAQEFVRDLQGRYWISQRGAVKIYSPVGRYIGQVGRPGEGPMEFDWPRPFHVDTEGHVHILDASNRRVTVVDEALNLVTERPLPGSPQRAVALNDGEVLVANMWHPTELAIGQPLHTIIDGEIHRSFGAPLADSPEPMLTSFSASRLLTVSKEGHVLGARSYEYIIEAWDTLGQRLTGFRGPVLNDAPVLPGQFSRNNPLPSRIFAIHMDRRDRLWILIWQVRDDWLAAVEEQVTPTGDIVYKPKPTSDWYDMFTGRIDVIDLPTRDLVARHVGAPLGVGFVADTLIVAPEYLPNGTPRLGVHRISLNLLLPEER